jgi:hypothetical protein
MTLTVCIPVYRAGTFLAETLRSVLEQTYHDLRVEISVDPAEEDGTGKPEDSWPTLRLFQDDRRIHVVKNPVRLGWDRNIRALLTRVETPVFAILPHDDIWHPCYVEVLLASLRDEPDAVVAYGDLHMFGVEEIYRHAVELPRTQNLREQLFAFLLQGAEAMPWRGVTRSARLPTIGGFPTDDYLGFCVECEYALSLLLAGPALHIPRTLYYKRLHPPEVMSASRERVVRSNPIQLEKAWRAHVQRMRVLLDKGLATPARHSGGGMLTDTLLRAALAAAMLRRSPFDGRLLPEDLDLAQRVLRSLPSDECSRLVRSKFHLVLWRHAVVSGNQAEACSQVEQAVACNPEGADACLAMANDLVARGCGIEALDWIAQAERAFPNGNGQASLRRSIYEQLNWSPPPQ